MDTNTIEAQILFASLRDARNDDKSTADDKRKIALEKIIELGYDSEPKVMQFIDRINMTKMYDNIKSNKASNELAKSGE